MEKSHLAALLGVLGAGLLFAAGAARAGAPIPDDPEASKRLHLLGGLLSNADSRPVHIIFVHGIRASGAGTSDTFRGAVCNALKVKCQSTPDDSRIVPSPRPARPLAAEVMGEPFWRTDADWENSQAFVNRFKLKGDAVVFDEVNWWPLVFPLKCKLLVAPETMLSGRDEEALDLCAATTGPDEPWRHRHAWLTPEERATLGHTPPIGPGGVKVNTTLIKRPLFNWGLSDAVLALGPMRAYLRQAIDGAFDYARGPTPSGNATYVVVAESLGAFVVMDAFSRKDETAESGVRAVLSDHCDLYFFANQFRLLELSRIAGLPSSPEVMATERPGLAASAPQRAKGLLQTWADAPAPARLTSPPQRRQIVAFNDPTDILTWDVPKLQPSRGGRQPIVVNYRVSNGFRWFGLLSNPVAAHTGYSSNKDVLRLMLSPDPR